MRPALQQFAKVVVSFLSITAASAETMDFGVPPTEIHEILQADLPSADFENTAGEVSAILIANLTGGRRYVKIQDDAILAGEQVWGDYLPEPAPWALLGLGLIAIGLYRRR